MLAWPFFLAPHQFLYIRYFDADTIFGPWWKLHDLMNAWSSQLHLGYTHARDLSYISIQEVISALMTPLGSDLRNRISLICVSLMIFFVFWWFARVRFPRVPGIVAAIAAFFYAANPFVVAFIHDGYSGLLVDYALLPGALLVVEWARRRNQPAFLSLIPLIFIVTGMYNLTSVFVSLLGVLILEYPYIAASMRNLGAALAVITAFLLNIYWVAPLAYDLALHPNQPLRAESGNDIAVLTSAGTLTNAVLLRSFPEIWTRVYGARECTSCSFYESPWFMLAMLAIVFVAVAGLFRAKRYGLLVALAGSIVLATGYHYQNEIISIPYVILMGLPTFDAFRSNVKFSALTAILYSIGLLYFYQAYPLRRVIVFGALAALLVSLPYISGNMIERSPDRPPHFPNFVVTIPRYYADLNRRRDLLPDDTPTLLLPNMPLAAYRWGAYGNDFVPPIYGKPTLAVSYLPQPSAQLELILQRLTGQRTAPQVRQALLSGLGISRVLYRDDTTQTEPLPQQAFGSEIARFGGLHVLSNNAALPEFAITNAVDPVFGVTGITTYTGLWHRAATGFNPSASRDVCSGDTPLGLELTPSRHRGIQLLDVPVHCDVPLTLTLVVTPLAARSIVITAENIREKSIDIRYSSKGSVAMVQWKARSRRYTVRSKRDEDVFLGIASAGNAIPKLEKGDLTPARAANFGWLGYRFDPLPYAHYTIFNQNFDATWQGIAQSNGRWRLVPNFMADGFANAWKVSPGNALVIVNTMQLAVWISAAVGLVLLLLYFCILSGALRQAAK